MVRTRTCVPVLCLWDSWTPMTAPKIPVFLWSAEFDPANIEAPVAAMYAKLCVKFEDCPRFTQFQGHNHVSHIMSINSADDEVSRAVLEFVRSVSAR